MNFFYHKATFYFWKFEQDPFPSLVTASFPFSFNCYLILTTYLVTSICFHWHSWIFFKGTQIWQPILLFLCTHLFTTKNWKKQHIEISLLQFTSLKTRKSDLLCCSQTTQCFLYILAPQVALLKFLMLDFISLTSGFWHTKDI